MCAKFNLMCPGCGNAFVTGAGTPETDPSRTVHADSGDNTEIPLGPVQSALDIPEKMRLADERLALARLMGPDHACLTVRQFDQLRDDLETERARRERPSNWSWNCFSANPSCRANRTNSN